MYLEWVTCDRCNPCTSAAEVAASPKERGLFHGNLKEAIRKGWLINADEHVCRVCLKEAAADEGGEFIVGAVEMKDENP